MSAEENISLFEPPKGSTKSKQKYTQKQLETAVKLIKQNRISLSKASKTYNIPKGTLHNKVNNLVPIVAKKGPKTVLSVQEEDKLEKWILDKASLGYPLHPDDVKEVVKNFIASNSDRDRLFPNGAPGDKWMNLFLKRHPSITKRTAEVISKARAAVTEESLKNWFNEVAQYLKSTNQLDVMNDPSRIFNLDETGVQLCPKTGKVLALKNYRHTFDIAPGKEKESITVLCNFSADGTSAPPFIVFPGKRLSTDLKDLVPEYWAYGLSDSGWMVADTFEQYIRNIFHPWLLEKNITFPVIIFMDGHKSHVGMSLHEFCSENKIILYCLHPNATHILQPCDVAIFKPLKTQWKREVRKHKQKTQQNITKTNFPPIFAKAYDKAITPTIVKNGFRRCGLYPFDKNAVDYTKCMSNRLEEIRKEKVTHVVTIDDYYSTIKVVENEIGASLIQQFTESRTNKRNHEHGLFNIWNKCKNETEILSNQNSLSIDNTQANTTSAILEDIDIGSIETFVIDGIVHDFLGNNSSMFDPPPVISTPIDFNDQNSIYQVSELNNSHLIQDNITPTIKEGSYDAIDRPCNETRNHTDKACGPVSVEEHSSNLLELGNAKLLELAQDVNECSMPINANPYETNSIVPSQETLLQALELSKINKNHTVLKKQKVFYKTNDIYLFAIPLPWMAKHGSLRNSSSNDSQLNHPSLINDSHHTKPNTTRDIGKAVSDQTSFCSPLPDASMETSKISSANNLFHNPQPSTSKQTSHSTVGNDSHLANPQLTSNATRQVPMSCKKLTIDKFLTLPKFASKTSTTKKRQSNMPLAITSKRFKEYVENKEREKKDLADAKENRRIEREAKKNLKIKQTKTNNKKKVINKTKDTCNTKGKKDNTKNILKDILENENKDISFKNKKVSYGDYVYVTFETNRRPRHYVGVVSMINENDEKVKVNFLRKKSSKFDDNLYFIEPNVKDVSEVDLIDVKYVLPKPRIGRRGMFTFDCEDNQKLATELQLVE